MKIIHKLIIGFLTVTSFIWLVGYLAVTVAEESLEESIGEREAVLAERVLEEIEAGIYTRIAAFEEYSEDTVLQEALKKSNSDAEKTLRNGAREGVRPAEKNTLANRMLSEEVRNKIAFFRKKHGEGSIKGVTATNRHGLTVTDTGEKGPSRHDGEEWWRRAREERLFVADSWDGDAKEHLVSAAIRVDDENGAFAGVMKLTLGLGEAIEPLKSMERSSNGGHAIYTLLNKDGRVVYSTELHRSGSDFSVVHKELTAKHEGMTERGFIKTRNSEMEALISHAHSNGQGTWKGLGWTLMIENGRGRLFAPVNLLEKQILVVSALLTLLALIISIKISRTVSLPIKRLRDAVTSFGKGNLDERISVDSYGEIGELASAFNSMGERLKTTIASLDAELSERKRMENLVRHMAYHDSLTGLPNRLLFIDRLEQVMARGFWHKKHAAVLFIDLDRFKSVNDSLGHSAGDELIKTVAERLKLTLRDGDTVARFGGDEFTVLLQDVAREEDVHLVHEKIFKTLEKPVVLRGLEVYVNVSIGVSIYPKDGENTETLLKNADLAMYCAKEKGGNTYELYSPEKATVILLKRKNELRLDIATEDIAPATSKKDVNAPKAA